MFLSLLPLAAMAAAMPLDQPSISPNFPSKTRASAFNLIANITDPAKLQDPRFAPLQNAPLLRIRVGQGINSLGLSPDSDAQGATFWQNDTTVGRDPSEFRMRYSILADNLSAVDALDIIEDTDNEYALRVVLAGSEPGADGFMIADAELPEIWPVPKMLYPTMRETEMQLVVCDEEHEYVGHARYQLLIAHATRFQGGVMEHIEPNCVPVNMLAQCAELAPVYKDDIHETPAYNRDYLMEVPCYEDVASIDWSNYSEEPR